MGPYFPRKGIKPPGFGIKTLRRPMVQMAVPNTQIEPKVSCKHLLKSIFVFRIILYLL